MADRVETVLVLTALDIEHRAVLEHLSNISADRHPAGTIYSVGALDVGGASINVAVAEVGAGNAAAAAHAERGISRFQPDLLLFIGVAGGIKDVTHGDVVVASQVYGYGEGKADEEFLTRPVAFPLAHRIDQEVRQLIATNEWVDRVIGGRSEDVPKAILAPIAAGDVLVTSTKSPVYEFIRARYNDAAAVEMEGRGFSEAAHINEGITAVVIRGISDLIDDKDSANDERWQPIAARNASGLAVALIDQLREFTPATAEGTPEALSGVASRLDNAFYINVTALLSDSSALGLLSEDALEQLRGARAWSELDWRASLRLRHLCEEALRHWSAPAVGLESAVLELIGARVVFDGPFRTRNWTRYDPERGLSGDLDVDPHIYTDVEGRRFIMPLDPRWATTTTGQVMFNRGHVSFAGVGVLRVVAEDHAIVSPVVIGLPTQGHDDRVALGLA